MESVKELIHNSVGVLRSNSISNVNFSRPHYPTCVVYLGSRSALFHDELFEDIARGWGGSAEYIKFYSIESFVEKKAVNVLTGKELTESDVKAQITELLSADNVFATMTQVALYCIIDTTEIASAEDFKNWYALIQHIEEMLGVSTLSMLMVILNESLQFTDLAKSIKNKLLDLYEDQSFGGKKAHMYDSVFVFGNRLKNGSFIKVDPTESNYSNYNLFADLILLSNTRSEDYNERRARLYGSEKPALTAAYSFVQKPMAEIGMITLGIILQRIKELAAEQFIGGDELMKALTINKGRSSFYEGFYSDIKGLLPNIEFMEWLPGKSTSDKSFEEYNKLTDGCLQAFLEQNHFKIVATELLSRHELIIREIISLIAKELNSAQLIDNIPSNIRENAYDKAEIAFGTTETLQVHTAIEAKVKQSIAEGLRLKTDEALTVAVKRAETTMAEFKQICTEQEKMISIGEEGTRKNLTTFYGDKIQRYFNDFEKLTELFMRVLKVGNSRADILEILLNAMETFFESDAVYKLSFSEELITRLGNVDTERHAQEFIGQELIKNLDEKISFFSKYVFHGRVYEAYFLNTEGTNNNLLFNYLQDKELPPEVSRTFFNTCNNDMAESIWFFVCSEDNLRL